jgi:hypothetical protein
MFTRPTAPKLAGQYTRPGDQAFSPSPPQQYGHAQPIPNSNQGITAQPTFFKINKSLTPGPVAKLVIAVQQARL